MLVDQRGRTYMVRLQPKGTYHTHSGTLSHEEILGHPEGRRVETSGGMVLTAFRPRFADFALKMPRGAQVIYPKDLGPILMYADICPGATVLEAGTGSGALTIALLRAVGNEGSVTSYDLRDEHQAHAIQNIEAFFGKVPDNLTLRTGDVRDVPASDSYARVLLDLPEPWGPLAPIHEVLQPGGILCAYLPTVMQVQQLVVALPRQGFLHVETFEVMHRGWHVTERSIRPDHRMVGHTGFLTIARSVATPA
jgi:tRNA (adenine57-N1/adenine58-N1)-methyltransferase catalytic subunit